VIAQFLLVLREGLEATLIVSIIASYLDESGRAQDKRYLFLGVIGGLLLSFLVAMVLATTLEGLEGKGEQVFEGVSSLAAAVVLTYMIFWMRGSGATVQDSLLTKLTISSTTNVSLAVFSVALISVLREGLETVLFLITLFHLDPLGTTIGLASGIMAVMILGIAMMGSFRRLSPRRLFLYTSSILLLVSAGMTGFATHELIEAYGQRLPDFLTQTAWNINPSNPENPLHEDGSIGSVLKTLVGYDGDPEVLRLVTYLVYWAAVGYALFLRPRGKRPRYGQNKTHPLTSFRSPGETQSADARISKNGR